MNPKNYEKSPTRTKYCLNGLWDLSIDSDGIANLPQTWDPMPIKVPSPYNVNAFTRSHNRRYAGEEAYVQGGDFRLYPEYPVEWENAKCGFYRRTITVTEEMLENRVFLHFDAAAFHCMFYVNGTRIAETMEAFLPIDLEITDYVHAGENEIIAACESAGYLMYKGRDGRNRLDYPRGSFWGEFVSGIWQDAWLITRPKAYVDDIFAVSDVYKKELKIKFVSKHADGCTVDFTLKKWNTDEERRVIASADTADGEIKWTWADGEVELWDFLQPNLYELTACLKKDGVIVDEKTERIGFRTMTADGEKFVLNGRRINLKIDAWHYMGYSIQTPEYARAYYKMALDAGVNIIRLHAEPFPEFFIDIADEMGMMIVSESAVWASHCSFSYSPEFFEHSKEHLVRMILRDRNHPSVVMWSPENECIPAFMFCGSDYIKSIPELEEAVYDFLKVTYDYDTSRLISCDGSGDLGGRLPVNSLHYPHYDCPTKRGKPITIGEMGSMYYSTPDTVTKEFGRGALDSFDGRLQSVGSEAYYDLTGERKWASQVCVFNLIWYGLYPMPFEDRKLEWDDYTTPGIKPSRITPFMRTLNAGAQEDLPEYLPNPVWELTKQAYIETRTFIEHFPHAVWAGEETEFQVTVFSDQRDDAEFELVTALAGYDDENEAFSVTDTRTIKIRATEYTEEKIRFTPAVTGNMIFRVDLKQNGETIFTEKNYLTAYDKAEWEAKMAATGVKIVTDGELPENVPVLDCRNEKPYADFMKPVHQQNFFTYGEHSRTVKYPVPVSCRVFDSALSFGAVPVLLDGSGNAIAIDLTCAGEKRIVSGLDLTKNDAATAQITLYLAEKLAAETVVKPGKPYFLGEAASPTAALLTELGCEIELITKEDLVKMLRTPTDRLLIVDGSADFNRYEWISENNFRRVLITSPKVTPQLFRNELTVTDRKLFHLTASDEIEKTIGLTSNALYGLEANRETVLGEGALEYKYDTDDILLGTPDINWNCWNNVGEAIKTVAVRRSEMSDNHRIAALAKKRYAGSDLYITTLSANMDSAKVKNIWARLLSGFGIAMEMRTNDEMANLLSSGMYAVNVRKALSRTASADEDAAKAHPALNLVENGSAWRITTSKETADDTENKLYALYVTSPQDRRDLLLNPDFIDLGFSADSPAKVYLNDELLGEGDKFDITGIPLIGGINKLVVHIPGKSAFPKIEFRRVKKPVLDLTFSMYAGELKPISMNGVKWFANVNNTYSSHASFTRDHFWSTNENQRNGIALDFEFPEEITVRAFWYVAIQFHNEGTNFTPKKYRILAGPDYDHLEEVYVSLTDREMCYPRSRVFLELDKPVTAKAFRYELLEEAGKQFVMSDLTLFG